ncbi:MAG: formylglycine-generating enzyme family protein [Gammaproteobacteria bacterium]|nr:formylglycine-generating enzyme family protein [Gammaproteobacteria bacterium]
MHGPASVRLRPFSMRVEPVTNGEFLRFVREHPRWRRDRVPPVLASRAYLAAWSASPRADRRWRDRPVTGVSWYAALAYCASEGARLPTWFEWEFVAAADAHRRDAREVPGRDQVLLDRIFADGDRPPAPVGAGRADVYGIRDLHGPVWEWTSDYAGMPGGSRPHEAAAGARSCAATALGFADKRDYALLMRAASLSAMSPADASSHVGFRCVRGVPAGSGGR